MHASKIGVDNIADIYYGFDVQAPTNSLQMQQKLTELATLTEITGSLYVHVDFKLFNKFIRLKS